MRIAKIHLYRVQIPFKKPFKHATQVRTTTDNIVIATTLEDGNVGYGEGLPREYVTGETQEQVIQTLEQLDPKILDFNLTSLGDVISFLEDQILSRKNFPHDKKNNTLRCALELSILDAYCRHLKKTFLDVAAIVLKDKNLKYRSPVYYDGVLSLESALKILWSSLKLKIFGFRKIKLKIGEDIDFALKAVSGVRKIFGAKVDLRVDANGVWDLETARLMAKELKKFSISSIEQPLAHKDLAQMRELKKECPIPLMLDESLCSYDEAKTAIENQLCDLFNIRLSKFGGFINSLKIAQLARQNGLGYQLGCMVGETAILSAAGRQFATIDTALRYLEGSYDRYLLKNNLTQEDISFRKAGEAPALHGYGLGVLVDPDKLSQNSIYNTPIFR